MNIKDLLLPFGNAFQKIAKCIPAIVVEVEKMMKDGKISSTERKDLAMKIIESVAFEFGFRLNFIAKWVISFLIDQISKKLPSKDIDVPDFVLKVSGTW